MKGNPIIQAKVAEYAYVASVNSEVFHKPDSRWARQIKEKNLIGLQSREEVVQAARRPCKTCQP